MEIRVILRGALSGFLAGILGFTFARIFAEPYIQKAIDYESGRDDAIAANPRARAVRPRSTPQFLHAGVNERLAELIHRLFIRDVTKNRTVIRHVALWRNETDAPDSPTRLTAERGRTLYRCVHADGGT